jgi:hypothetical protein
MTQSAAEQAPASPLMMFILAALASMMAPTLSDLTLARLAAQEAIEAYRTRGQHELITIGQIVGFAITALDTLRLSMPEDISLSMKLRLRGSANGLNRSSRDCTRLLEKARPSENDHRKPATPAPVQKEKTERKPAMEEAATEPAVENQVLTGTDWADAMQSVAVALQADATTVSSEQRETDALWIEALNGVGGELRQANHQPVRPGAMRSKLMATLDPGVPPHLFRHRK